MEIKNSDLDDHIIRIIEELQKAGYETYLVGGAIRDLLLGRTPKDFDISTAATPEEVKAVFGKRKSRIIGKRFRLVHYYHGNEIVEISTFRRAPQEVEGETPFFDNDFGTAQEDAWRRDFTVNSLFYNPTTKKIIDYTGNGLSDIETRTVRVVGAPLERFEEDPVRILRALKLVGQYGFSLHPDTKTALKNSISLITQCSHSRLALELEKIIRRPYSHSIFSAFYEYGFLAYYLPYMHEHWNTDNGKFMIEILKLRNERTLQGKYRDSISLALACAAYPFIESALPAYSEPDLRGWKYFSGIEKQIRKHIIMLFAPYHFPKRIIFSSIGTIMLIPSFINMINVKRVLNSSKYLHGKELMTIINTLKWDDHKLAEFWPLHGTRRKPKTPYHTCRKKKQSEKRHKKTKNE
jgi:poly(A) polymerase